jgi:hypothetical protein
MAKTNPTMKKLLFLLLMTGVIENVLADDLTTTITNATVGSSNGAIDLAISGGAAPFIILWSGPGGFSSSDEDISGLMAGEYCVTVSDNYCGVATLCVLVEEDLASGIETQETSLLSVFPNPFSKEFSIVFNAPAAGEFVIGLHDLGGKMIWTENRKLVAGMNTCHFILPGDLAAGRYEMNIRDRRTASFAGVWCISGRFFLQVTHPPGSLAAFIIIEPLTGKIKRCYYQDPNQVHACKVESLTGLGKKKRVQFISFHAF